MTGSVSYYERLTLARPPSLPVLGSWVRGTADLARRTVEMRSRDGSRLPQSEPV